MSLIRHIGALRTLSFTVGVMLGSSARFTPSRAPTTNCRPIGPDHNWHSIGGRPSPATDDSRPQRRSISVSPSTALPQARRSCTTRITRCNSSTTRSCARRIPRSDPRRDAPE
jgi:hypothetical protein